MAYKIPKEFVSPRNFSDATGTQVFICNTYKKYVKRSLRVSSAGYTLNEKDWIKLAKTLPTYMLIAGAVHTKPHIMGDLVKPLIELIIPEVPNYIILYKKDDYKFFINYIWNSI